MKATSAVMLSSISNSRDIAISKGKKVSLIHTIPKFRPLAHGLVHGLELIILTAGSAELPSPAQLEAWF